MSLRDIIEKLEQLETNSVSEGTHTQHYKPEPEKKGILGKIGAAAKRVADVVAPPDEELVSRLEKETGGKRPAKVKEEQGVAEGMDPEKRSRLDDLIDQFRDSTDPNDYYDRDYSDPEDVIAMIRAEFGDRIADKVAAGAGKMHFGRPGHTSWRADPLGWKKPVDRKTKAGKMFKQDSDFRKNTIKSRYKLSGKSATEGVAEGISVVNQDYDLDQMILTLDINGKKVSFTYWDYDENFKNAERKDVFDQLKEKSWYVGLDHPTKMEILDAAYKAIRGEKPSEYKPTVDDEPMDVIDNIGEQGVAEGSDWMKPLRSPQPSGIVVYYRHPDSGKIKGIFIERLKDAKDIEQALKNTGSEIQSIALKYGNKIDHGNANRDNPKIKDYFNVLQNQGVAEGSKRPDFGAGIGDIHVVYMDGKPRRKFKREDDAIDYADDLYDRTGNETIEVQNSEGGVVYSFLDEQQGVAESLLNENVTELYHGTLVKNVPSILANGLNPTVGEFTRSIYANKAKPLVFAADASGSRGVYCALVGQMHAKLNITTYPPSAEDVAKHCAILVISKDVGKFRQYNAKRRQGSKEPTDYTSEQTIHIDKVLSGKELLQWIKTHNADRGEMCPIDNQQGVTEDTVDEGSIPLYKSPSQFYAGAGKTLYKLFRNAFPNLPEHVANDIYNQTSPGTNDTIVNALKQGQDPKSVFLNYYSGITFNFSKDPGTSLTPQQMKTVLLNGRWRQKILTVNPADFAEHSRNRMVKRNFGINPDEDPTRIQRQQSRAKGDGSNEPVIIIQTSNGLILWEGFHRTMSILALGKNGEDPLRWNKVKLRAWVVTFQDSQNSEQGVAEDKSTKKISFKLTKGKNKFSTTMMLDGVEAGVYQYNANSGRSIAEVFPEFKGQGYGKILVLNAIYTAAKLGMDFIEDESRTAEYDNVLDSLSDNGLAVNDDGYWYVTGEGEHFLKQRLKQDVAEGYKEPTDAAGHLRMAKKIKKMLDDTLADRGDRHGNADPQRLTRAYEYHMEKATEKSQGVAEGFLGDREYNRVMPFVKRIAGEVSDYDRDEFGEELWSLLDQKYGSKFAQSVLDDLDFYWDAYTELTGQQGVAEAVHPDITGDEYFNDPTENVRMGNFEFNARTFSGALGDPNARGLQIRAYDPKRPNGGLSIGSADFIVKSDKKGRQWLESDDTEVDEKYRNQGVAAMMYAFAKSLGNDIKPSPYQSTLGKRMWKKWGKDAQHLVGEQGVAEGSDKLQGTPVVSLSDFDSKDTKKDRYGRTVPKKLNKDDPRVKFHKDQKQGVAESSIEDSNLARIKKLSGL